MNNKWHKLICDSRDLQLLGTLNGGQSFRWKYAQNEWIGVFSNKVWMLKQEENEILYKVFEQGASNCPVENNNDVKYNHILMDYFQLNLPLADYYEKWSEKDPYFKAAAKQFYGIRILKQDATENIFSFICSSNNNISRISSMVEKLAKFYGEEICEISGEKYYSFPSVQSLDTPTTESQLRDLGFGYRAKYISNTAAFINANGGDDWLDALKKLDYPEAKNMLMTLTGIGAKVADCICLMSLGHLDAIPVDTHIYQIAQRLYMPKLCKQKTVTTKIYNEIGNHFRDLYGPLAGWAHTVLFCADLKKFQTENTENVQKSARKKMKTK